MGWDSGSGYGNVPDLSAQIRTFDDPQIDLQGRSRIETADRTGAPPPLPPRHERWYQLRLSGVPGVQVEPAERMLLREVMESERPTVAGTFAAREWEHQIDNAAAGLPIELGQVLEQLEQAYRRSASIDRAGIALRVGRMIDVFGFIWKGEQRDIGRAWLERALADAGAREPEIATAAQFELNQSRAAEVPPHSVG